MISAIYEKINLILLPNETIFMKYPLLAIVGYSFTSIILLNVNVYGKIKFNPILMHDGLR